MKRIVSVLLAICLVLASCSVALAAKATITQQPETTTVKKGGTLVYSTCSILPEENGEQIRRFLASHPDFSLSPARWL